MIRQLAMGLLCLLATGTAQAQQQQPTQLQRVTPHGSPSLTALANGVRSEKHVRDIVLEKLDIAVELRGGIAETIVTARFANKGSEVLEADFRLVLPADAVVAGYALDIKQQIVEGVLVDRPQARAVYEAAVRRGIDPGLAEVDAEGTFKTRVFPVPVKGSRTIRVRYVAPLFNSHRGEDVFVLPLDAAPERWSIGVRASGVAAAPSLTWPGRGPIAMVRTGDGFAAREEGTRALEGLLILGRPALPEAVASRNAMGEQFVQLSGAMPGGSAMLPSDRVRIYWDRSRGRLGEHKDELELLRRALAVLKPNTIEIVTFSSSGARRQAVASADAAIALLKGVTYRGASSFAPLAAEKAPADRCLLFSDGRPSIDRSAKVELPCRVDAVTAARTADLAWLRNLASAHGGRAYRLGDDLGAAERSLVRATPGVTAVLDDQGRRLPFVPIESSASQWLVAARAPDRGGVRVVIGRTELRRALPEARPFAGEGALLATDALATLGGTERRADYVALSRRYGVASPSLSFLVLETPQDYVQADIAPPEGYPKEDLAIYRSARQQADEQEAQVKKAQLEKVAGMWAEQVSWWNRRFVQPRPEVKRANDQEARREPGASAPEPAPPMLAVTALPAPAPPPPPAEVSGNTNERNIVVTGARVQAGMTTADATAAEDIGRFPDTELVARPRIEIEAWQPERPYLKAFDAAPQRFDALFAEEEKKHGTLPAFYLDTAGWLHRRGRTAEAVEMVLAALDLPVANEVTYGIVADRLERYGAYDRAVELRERHAALDPARPQPKRLLALALARRAAKRPANARADLERAIALLAEVALTPQDGRWDGIELIALMEANALIPKLRALGGETSLDRRLIALLDTDLRVVADWNTDATDLDLWVDEPHGERAIYSHQRTASGGQLSNDMTNGYGPEEYFLRRAFPGTYTVRANVFAADRIDPNGPSVVTVRLIRDFGRSTEREEAVDLEVTSQDGRERLIGRLVVDQPR